MNEPKIPLVLMMIYAQKTNLQVVGLHLIFCWHLWQRQFCKEKVEGTRDRGLNEEETTLRTG